MELHSNERLGRREQASESLPVAKEMDSGEQDIFVGQFEFAASAASFSNQSIVPGIGPAAPAEISVEGGEPARGADAGNEEFSIAAAVETARGPDAESKREMIFAEAFKGTDEAPLIETIFPVAQTRPAMGLLAEAIESVETGRAPGNAEPKGMVGEAVIGAINPNVDSLAQARVERVRKALFGSAKAEAKSIPMPIRETKPLAG